MSAPGSPPARLASLDVLRALAVLLVVGRHVILAPRPTGGALDLFLRTWARGGWIGVDLFFVLSGFLVSGLLFREYQRFGTVKVGRFLIRRGLKIYPAFYCFLAVTCLRLVARGGLAALPLPALASEALFVQNYGPSLWWHTWSLAVEEHFYLLCALLTAFLVRRGASGGDPFRALPAITGVLAALCLGGRLATAALLPYAPEPHLFPTHLRLDALMFGVCLSYLHHFQEARLRCWLAGRERRLLALGVLLMAPPFLLPLDRSFFIETGGLTCLSLGSGLLVAVLASRGLPDVLPVRVAAFVGAYSYSIYLWHPLVRDEAAALATALLRRPPWSPEAAALYGAGTFAVGILMAKLVELPVLRLRDRLFPSRSAALAKQPPPVDHTVSAA